MSSPGSSGLVRVEPSAKSTAWREAGRCKAADKGRGAANFPLPATCLFCSPTAASQMSFSLLSISDGISDVIAALKDDGNPRVAFSGDVDTATCIRNRVSPDVAHGSLATLPVPGRGGSNGAARGYPARGQLIRSPRRREPAPIAEWLDRSSWRF